MDASDFDYETACTACADGVAVGYDECPVCHGDGTMNRLHDGTRLGLANGVDAHPSEDVFVLLNAGKTDAGLLALEYLPVRSEVRGGLEGRYGTWTPSDVDSGPMADYQADTRDQLTNDGLAGGPSGSSESKYDTHGVAWDPADIPGDISTADLSIDQAIAWARARGDDATADRFAVLADERPTDDGSD